MPLNISIDVDGTILDANENLLPHARESIQLLKDAGHCLQLWSAGGADYAYKHALKNKLTDLFESYAKKSDIAIDDLPETAHPLAAVHVDHNHTLDQAVKKVLGIEQNVDAALTLNSVLVNFVQQLQTEENHIREQYGAILRPNIPLHPIPFFGVIENARVVTVGLNPSTTEFTKAGRWPQILTPCELAQRLVRYFREPEIPPHYWFAELQWSLEILHCPYHFAAAHVDASPWTTFGPRHLEANVQNIPHGLERYNHLLNAGIQTWLPRTFEFCKDTVRLVVICLRNAQIEQKIREALGPEWNGEIVVMSKNEVPRWAWENRDELIRLLDVENIFP
jgi:hypothetical protein